MDLLLKVFKNYSLQTIKTKFIVIYLLNVSDIVITLLLLKSGIFTEGNIIMQSIVSSEGFSTLIKLILPLLLLVIIFKRMSSATEKQLKIGNILINICLIFYCFVNLSHIMWIILYNKYIF